MQRGISSTIEWFARLGQIWHLEELKTIAEEPDDDLASVSLAESTWKFVFTDYDFQNRNDTSVGNVALMVEEIKALEPYLPEITGTNLTLLLEY